jgi:hypothetical protein
VTDFDTTQADAPADAGAPVIDNAPAPEAQQDAYDPNAFYKDDKPKTDMAPPTEQEDAPEDDDAPAPDDAPEAEPIEAPVSWSKDYKAQFEALPREMQEIISTREKERETFLQSKSREAAQTRQAVETEARTALQTIMENHTQQLQQYAQRLEVPPPNQALLESGDPEHMRIYMQQEAAYRNATAQREQLTQQAREAQQHAEAIAAQQHQVELQAEHALLEERLGNEWADPSSRAKLLGDLTPIAAELGYPQELIAQARACDIIAMKKTAEWKAKAEKFDALNKARMVPVREAKNRPIPPAARPGAPAGNRQPTSTVELLYPNDVRRN